MKYFQFENMLDTILLFLGMIQLIIILRVYRYDTFLKDPDQDAEAVQYFRNYIQANERINENLLLFIYGALLWVKAVY